MTTKPLTKTQQALLARLRMESATLAQVGMEERFIAPSGTRRESLDALQSAGFIKVYGCGLSRQPRVTVIA